MRDATRSSLIFGVASLAAVAAGCVAMNASDVPPASWGRTVVAWVAGGLLALLVSRFAKSRSASIAVVVLATVALIATLFAAEVDGVHRWLDLGPLHINIAALFLPVLIVGLAAIGITTPAALLVTLIVSAILVAQPDASQLTAFALAALVLLLRSALAPRWKLLVVVLAVAFIIGGWLRPDPLQPVPEVEQIFTLCTTVSPILALLAGFALTAAAVAPLAFRNIPNQPARDAAIALAAYFVAVSIAPFLGWFPVPLVGLGMSFPAGWWIGMGMLIALARRQ